MIYMFVFWLIVLTFFALYVSAELFRLKRLKLFMEDNGALFFLMAAPFVLMAIVTNDPVSVLGGGSTYTAAMGWLAAGYAFRSLETLSEPA